MTDAEVSFLHASEQEGNPYELAAPKKSSFHKPSTKTTAVTPINPFIQPDAGKPTAGDSSNKKKTIDPFKSENDSDDSSSESDTPDDAPSNPFMPEVATELDASNNPFEEATQIKLSDPRKSRVDDHFEIIAAALNSKENKDKKKKKNQKLNITTNTFL